MFEFGEFDGGQGALHTMFPTVGDFTLTFMAVVLYIEEAFQVLRTIQVASFGITREKTH